MRAEMTSGEVDSFVLRAIRLGILCFFRRALGIRRRTLRKSMVLTTSEQRERSKTAPARNTAENTACAKTRQNENTSLMYQATKTQATCKQDEMPKPSFFCAELHIFLYLSGRSRKNHSRQHTSYKFVWIFHHTLITNM